MRQGLFASLGKKQILIIVIIAAFILSAIAATVYIANQRQEVRSRAQVEPTPTSSACPAPAQVNNVKIEYPSCSGNQCDFNQASCSWDAVSGAVSYTVKTTEVDSNTVVKTETIQVPTVKTVFPVTQGKTYRCDVSAVNSCGTTGGIGTDSLLCQVGGIFPTSTIVPTVAPTVVPTVVPTSAPAVLSCGIPNCNINATCQSGFICIQANSGQFYCANPSFQAACKSAPSITSCCQAPVVPTVPLIPTIPPAPTLFPTLAPTGNVNGTVIFGIGGIAAVILGGALFILAGL